ncbi:MAG: response regulator [Alphaproteobacteria bacterium]|nr:response regulator [Alphaproteobacteria bacterium]
MPNVANALENEKILVLDQNEECRALAMSILKDGGARAFVSASGAQEAYAALRRELPTLLVMGWLEGAVDALDFIRSVRRSDDIPNRSAPIVLLTQRGRQSDVEAARAAGADAYLIKPISIRTALQKIAAVLANPQPFVATASYTGPCRRRRSDADYTGPKRRITDVVEAPVHDEALERERVALRSAAVDTLVASTRMLKSQDPQGARAVFAAALEVKTVALGTQDPILMSGVEQLTRYLESVGATGLLDPDAVRTHAEALRQLAELPNVNDAARNAVAAGLEKMVEKKLRQAIGASA